jgi:predicted aspartyl protease
MTFTRAFHKIRVTSSRRTLLLVPLTVQSEILITTAVAQSRKVDDSFLVDARVNGFPAVLLLDTGAEHSLLDRNFAQRLGLRPVAEASLERPYSSEKLRLTDDLTAGSGALEVHIDGVLGNDFLCKFRVTLDYSAGSVTFDHLPVLHHGAPIKLHRIGNRYFVHLNFDGVSLIFLLDTGTNFSALSNSGWARLNESKRALSVIDGVRSSGTAATSKLVCIHKLTIGRASYENLPMRVQPPTSAGFFAWTTYWAVIS